MDIKTIRRTKSGEVELFFKPRKELIIILPFSHTVQETADVSKKGMEVCAYLKDLEKNYTGFVNRDGSIRVHENVLKPESISFFRWDSGAMVVTHREYEERKRPHEAKGAKKGPQRPDKGTQPQKPERKDQGDATSSQQPKP